MDQLDAIFGAMKSGMDNVGNKAAEFRGLCGKCLLNITDDDFSKTGETMFHNSCFKCGVCASDLRNKPYYFTNMTLFCEADYVKSNFPTCKACAKPVMDEVVEFKDDSYHSLCFVCATCGVTLAGAKFVPHEGKLYCVDDFSQKTAPTCKKCGKKILTTKQQQECVKVHEERYHLECFVCTVCHNPFKDDKVRMLNGEFYCETHYTLAKAGKTSLLQQA
eukprot:Unigene3816_Nuclearia_a/m.11640 Unigene3816_Nuclearia_a/g.11640  ORF Unigene3816_Nuclearia_a/g.11640 Unigene3816_Nuclearia_a/m.11640 type:complete len:219 (-) Unigene3816_Nuclearia_a:75-731(-)